MNNDGLTLNQLAERNAVLVTEVEKLRAERDQLAAENVALKNAITDHSHSVHFCEVCGKDDPCSTDDVCYALKDIPATDAYLAGIKADGAEACVRALVTSDDDDFADAPNICAMVAYQLRDGGNGE